MHNLIGNIGKIQLPSGGKSQPGSEHEQTGDSKRNVRRNQASTENTFVLNCSLRTAWSVNGLEEFLGTQQPRVRCERK